MIPLLVGAATMLAGTAKDCVLTSTPAAGGSCFIEVGLGTETGTTKDRTRDLEVVSIYADH